MSCTIVSNNVMSVASNFLSRILNNGFDSFGFEVKDEMKIAFKSCYVDGHYSAQKIHQRLYELNIKAYHDRYGKNAVLTVDKTEGKDYEINDCDLWEPRTIDDHAKEWHYRTLKCLQDVYYQLCEGEVYGHAETKALGMLINSFALFIVTHTKDYEDAKLM